MATSRDDKKLTFLKFEEGDDTWSNWPDAIFDGDTSHKCPTGCEDITVLRFHYGPDRQRASTGQ